MTEEEKVIMKIVVVLCIIVFSSVFFVSNHYLKKGEYSKFCSDGKVVDWKHYTTWEYRNTRVDITHTNKVEIVCDNGETITKALSERICTKSGCRKRDLV